VKAKSKPPFTVATFLATVDGGRTVSTYQKNKRVFLQGDPADSVFYIQEGEVKVCVVSEQGKEAVVAIHAKGDFFGEGCLTGQPRRLATVATMTESVITRLDKAAIMRVLNDEQSFPRRSCRICWRGTLESRRIWSISFSIRARSVLRGYFS